MEEGGSQSISEDSGESPTDISEGRGIANGGKTTQISAGFKGADINNVEVTEEALLSSAEAPHDNAQEKVAVNGTRRLLKKLQPDETAADLF